MFRYAVIDELVATDPTMAVTRPRVPWEGQRRTVLHPLEFAAVLSAARRHSDTAHALVAMLGMLGLRVSEACNARVQDLRYAGAARVCAGPAEPEDRAVSVKRVEPLMSPKERPSFHRRHSGRRRRRRYHHLTDAG